LENGKIDIVPAAGDVIHKGDMLVVIGRNDNLKQLEENV
jgi:K+/H+ antiporter YhaU regulatory subunit KhtT